LGIAVVVLAISVAAPEMSAPAGAVAVRSTNRTELQARPAVRQALVAKRRKRRARRVVRSTPLTVAQRKARLVSYLKAHPGLVAKRLGTTAAKVKHPVVKKRPLAKKGVKAAKRLAPRRRPVRRAALGAAKKPKAVKNHALGMSGWAELFLLALLPFGAVGATLLGTDRARRPREPRAPSPSKRRRTLVITPMRGR